MNILSVKNLALSLFFILIYAGSGIAQNCNQNIVQSTPASRFMDNGDGTVTDRSTGLMWKKCSEGQTGSGCTGGTVAGFTWQEALQRAQYVNSNGGFAGYSDWRVPNIKELESIVEEQCEYPAINISVFPNMPTSDGDGSAYWSSSPEAVNNLAWVVYLHNGGVRLNGKSVSYYVRLVRGGQ